MRRQYDVHTLGVFTLQSVVVVEAILFEVIHQMGAVVFSSVKDIVETIDAIGIETDVIAVDAAV